MIRFDTEGNLDYTMLDKSRVLPSDIINEYDYSKIRKEVRKLINFVENNYFYQVAYQEFLKYTINDDLEMIIVEDPSYDIKSFSCKGELKNDTSLKYFTKADYNASYLLCEFLVRRIRDAYNNLDEFEKFLFKNFEYDRPNDIKDEAISNDIKKGHNYYYDQKKSAYIKIAIQLGLTLDEDTDKLMEDKLKQAILDRMVITFKLWE